MSSARPWAPQHNVPDPGAGPAWIFIMSRQPTAALAAIPTEHGRVLVRKVFEKRQQTFVLVLQGPAPALQQLCPGRVHAGQERVQISPALPCRTVAALMHWFQHCLAAWLAAIRLPRQPTVVTVGDCIDRESERLTGTIRASSRVAYEGAWKALDRMIGRDHLVVDLTSERIQRLVATLTRQGWSGRSIRNLLGALQRLLQHAVAGEVLPANPVIAVVRPALTAVRGCVLSPDQRHHLLAAATQTGPSLHLAVALGLLAGLRPGEIQRLRWEDLLIGRRMVLVRCRPAGLTKSGKERSVPMCTGLRDVLLRYQRRDGQVVEAAAEAVARGRRWRFNGALAAVGRAASMPWLRPHDLRRAFASAAAQSGVGAFVLQRWLGHHSVTETQRYVTVPEGYDASVEGVDAAATLLVAAL